LDDFLVLTLFFGGGLHNKVIPKVRQLGGENGYFRHNRESNTELGMKMQ
jgi:hypothetical protein